MTYCVYVSLQAEDKILRFSMDPTNGRLEREGEVAAEGGPAPLAIHPTKRFLYAARRGAKKISSFAVDPTNGALTEIGSISLPSDPPFITPDRTGRFLLSAYYQAGAAAVHRIAEDGTVVEPALQWLETATGAHSIQTDPSNRFAFLPHIADRGPNEIWQFGFDASTGALTPNEPPKLRPESKVGPRHFCFHPHKDIVYFCNEQGCSVSTYHLDREYGTLTHLQTLPTLPDDYHEPNTCAEIRIDLSGRFLYASNRGHNSIACFTVDAASSLLSGPGWVATEAVPRAFSLDPDGRFLFVAGLETGRLASYAIDGGTGGLEPLERYEIGARPMWVLATRLGD
jgi:6-phosphogluconolactonase